MGKQEKDTAIYVAFDDNEPLDPSVPEKNLLRAILVTAMADLKKSGEVARRAREYFLSADEAYIFSFRSVCDFLNVDARKVLVVTGLKGPRTKAAQAAPSLNVVAPVPAADKDDIEHSAK